MQWHLTKTNLRYYSQMMRLDKPVGIYLLLWPTWWALWLASHGTPDFAMWLIFSLGVILMRSAGCVINDYADRNFDGAVERTKNRPLAAQLVQPQEALQLFALLLVLSASLLLFFKLANRFVEFSCGSFGSSLPLHETLYAFSASCAGRGI